MDQDIQKQLDELRQRALAEVKQNKKKLNKGKEEKAAAPAQPAAEPPEDKPENILSKKEEPAPEKKTVVSVLNPRPDDGFEDEEPAAEVSILKKKDGPEKPAETKEKEQDRKETEKPVQDKSHEKASSPVKEKNGVEKPAVKKEAKKKAEAKPVKAEPEAKDKSPSEPASVKKEEGKSGKKPRRKGPHYVSRRKVIYVDKDGEELVGFYLRTPSSDRQFPLNDENSIGKDPSSDINLTSRYVSRQHARIFRENDAFYIEDLNSTNGTFIKGIKISGRVQIYPGDRIVFGDEPLVFDADSATKRKDAAAEKEYAKISLVRKDTGEVYRIFSGMTIGRDAGCDISIPEPEGHYVSGQHAVINISKNDIRLKDLESSNGTYVGASKIKSKSLYAGNMVRFADIEFEVIEA